MAGVCGGILYGIADYFLYINSSVGQLNPDPAWAEMSPLRFTFPMIFAVMGSWQQPLHCWELQEPSAHVKACLRLRFS